MISKKVLLSFVGLNDAGQLQNKDDGAILTALKNEKFDEVHLLWNNNAKGQIQFDKVVKYLSEVIKKRKYSKRINLAQFNISDVTDHNEIYQILKSFTDNLEKKDGIEYTAAISSGTPAMQVCWILLAESGDFSEEFPLKLIKVKDPKFGKSANIIVRLDTSLPKILRLKKEIESVKKDLIPIAEINLDKGIITIGDLQVDLSPIEFCHYRYFAERIIDSLDTEKFSGISVSLSFAKKIYSYHKESFPNLDSNRMDLEKIINDGIEMAMPTFRGNITKIKKKIREALEIQTLVDNFQITITGKRGAKFYGIKAPKLKIRIIA